MTLQAHRRMEVDITRLRESDMRAIARALTLVESRAWQPATVELLKALFPYTGNAFVLGITGSPGAGKSTLVDQLALFYRNQGRRVAIIAVDPTSPFSGGAVLGDRVRMHSLADDPDVFIRSMATRGQLGGLCPSIHEAILVLDAAGFDTLLVETVGVGQDEVDIVRAADVSLVMLVPGMGDDIQTIKAGIMEIGDVFIINKADREGSLRIEKELGALLSIAQREDGWQPPIVKTIALKGDGVENLAGAIEEFGSFLEKSGARRTRSLTFLKERLLQLLQERLSALLRKRIPEEHLHQLAQKIMTRENDPYTIIDDLLGLLGLEGKE